jgi:transcriptional regulator with XRE-family HTH domain
MSAPPRTEVAEFLRARREAVRPEQVGLPRAPGRRAPGLRREEVALLAGVSVSWYTWLEQGRRISASDDVLRAIARALLLDEAATAHLLTIARPPTAPVRPPAEAPDALVRLITSMEPAPAYVLGPTWEFLAWNDAEARLYPAIGRLEGIERNLLWVHFADPAVRELIVDWDIHARQTLAEFRAATVDRRAEPDHAELVERLAATSPEFAAWWPEHTVARFETRLRRFHHPAAGQLTFEYQQLAPVEWPGLRVVCHLPVPGDDSAQRLAVRHYLV